MGLKNANAAAFEDEATTGATDAAVEKADAKVEAQATETAVKDADAKVEVAPAADAKVDAADTSTAVQEVKASPLAVKTAGSAAVMKANVFTETKDAFPIEYDSLPRIKAELGEMLMADGEESLGDFVRLQLISFQDRWVASPGDNKADIELVKFSDNETTAADGTNLDEHVEALKAMGWPKAKKQHRMVVVGELLETGDAVAGEPHIGTLVQIDLPESGRRSFKGHALQATFKVAKGRATPEEAHNVKFKAEKARNKDNEAFTKIVVGA